MTGQGGFPGNCCRQKWRKADPPAIRSARISQFDLLPNYAIFGVQSFKCLITPRRINQPKENAANTLTINNRQWRVWTAFEKGMLQFFYKRNCAFVNVWHQHFNAAAGKQARRSRGSCHPWLSSHLTRSASARQPGLGEGGEEILVKLPIVNKI